MKKKILSLLMVTVMAIGLTACGDKEETGVDANNENGTEANDEVNEERTTLVVGFDAEFPPYGYMGEDGEYTGFDLELAQEVCERNGWTLEKKPINWDSKDMELESNSIDCIWNGFTMNGREDDYTWSDAYVDNSIVVAVAADSDITKLEDLAGKVVAVQVDSSGLAALEGEDATEENVALRESFGTLQQVSDYNSAFMNLEAGAVDAVVLDIGVAKYQLKNNPDKYVILEDVVSSEKYGVGFKKGNTELMEQVQATLYEMLEDGTMAKIAENYKDFNLPDMICLGE